MGAGLVVGRRHLRPAQEAAMTEEEALERFRREIHDALEEYDRDR
jgi:hypothetical protein